jgi:hypothetical protein
LRGDLVDILRDEPLDEHAILPDAVELAVLQLDADLAKAHARHQTQAGVVLGEDA